MASYDRRQQKRQRMDNEGRRRRENSADDYTPRKGFGGGGSDKPNHVLLMTVINPAYPITVEVVHTICSPFGKVNKIVICSRRGVQAMVEFDCLESANRAMNSLNGADIYSGCCTLKIEYAKPTTLTAPKNDSYSWGDFTDPLSGRMGNRAPLLQAPPPLFGFGPHRDTGRRSPNMRGFHGYGGFMPHGGPRSEYSNTSGSSYGSPDRYGFPPRDRYGGLPLLDRYRHERRLSRSPPRRMAGFSSMQEPSTADVGEPGSVMIMYDLNTEKLNTNKMFNLFCLYGNVIRVKFLPKKDGCAMVQMGDAISVARAIGSLNNCMMFGSKMRIDYSKQPTINAVRSPFDLPDGSPSFRDYATSRNNRFNNPKLAVKNRIQPPAKILHFFNAPSSIQEEDLQKVFEEASAAIPKLMQTFPSKNKRSISGLLEFKSVTEAVEALILCNHKTLPNPKGNFPFILKLCFSAARNRPEGDEQSG